MGSPLGEQGGAPKIRAFALLPVLYVRAPFEGRVLRLKTTRPVEPLHFTVEEVQRPMEVKCFSINKELRGRNK